MGPLASSPPGPALWRPASTTCWWGIARRASFQADRDRTDVRRPGGGPGGGQGRSRGGSYPEAAGPRPRARPGPGGPGEGPAPGCTGPATAGSCGWSGAVAGLAPPPAAGPVLATLRTEAGVVCAKPPFGGPKEVLQVVGGGTRTGWRTSPRVDYPARGGYASAALPQEGDLVGCGVGR